MTKKACFAVLIAMLFALTAVFSACSGSGGTAPPTAAPTASTSTESASTTTAQTETASTETVTAEPASNFNLTGYPIVNEPITLKAWVMIQDHEIIEVSSDLWSLKRMQERTNINVEYTAIKFSDWEIQFNLMVSSNDYPDVSYGSHPINVDEYGVSQGILLPVNDLVDKYMPIYKERLVIDPFGTSRLYRSDGNMYSIGRFMAQGINCSDHWFINRTWLDAVGMSKPTTVAELTDVLRAFRDKKPGGPNTIPWMAGEGSIRGMAPTLWGIPANSSRVFLDDNKKVQFAPYQPGFRESMEWLHLLYSENLLDPDVMNHTGTLYYANLNEGNAGLFTGWRLTMMDYDGIVPHAEFMLPVSADGYKAKMSGWLELASQDICIYNSNKYLPETARWIDAHFETQTMFENYLGPEGIAWEYGDDRRVVDMFTTSEVMWAHGLGVSTPFYAPFEYYNSVFVLPSYRIEKMEYCKRQNEAGVMEKNKVTEITDLSPLTGPETDRKELLFSDIDVLYKESITQFILSGVTDAAWDDFLSKCDRAGADEYVKIYQDAFDRR